MCVSKRQWGFSSFDESRERERDTAVAADAVFKGFA